MSKSSMSSMEVPIHATINRTAETARNADIFNVSMHHSDMNRSQKYAPTPVTLANSIIVPIILSLLIADLWSYDIFKYWVSMYALMHNYSMFYFT